jgi:hypothetical protein
MREIVWASRGGCVGEGGAGAGARVAATVGLGLGLCSALRAAACRANLAPSVARKCAADAHARAARLSQCAAVPSKGAVAWSVRMNDGHVYEFHAASAEARDTWTRAVMDKVHVARGVRFQAVVQQATNPTANAQQAPPPPSGGGASSGTSIGKSRTFSFARSSKKK